MPENKYVVATPELDQLIAVIQRANDLGTIDTNHDAIWFLVLRAMQEVRAIISKTKS